MFFICDAVDARHCLMVLAELVAQAEAGGSFYFS